MTSRLAIAGALCVGWTALGAPALAQVQFSIADTQACLATATDSERVQCVGKGASACMSDSPEGDTTYGMVQCLDAEFGHWDARLNEAYSALITANGATDAELKDIGSSAPEQVPALRAMQRAWIEYRDSTCEYEASWWGGGTGAGPAGVDCALRLTAQQTLYLEDALSWGN